MPIATRIFASLAGLFHVLFFFMESVFWMNPKVHARFLVQGVEDAERLRLFALNQGFYNVFLAFGCLAGVALVGKWKEDVGRTLVVYTCAFMVGAALVLVFSKPRLVRSAVIQGLFPLLALLTYAWRVSRPR